MLTEQPNDLTGWMKVRDVPGAPQYFELTKNGQMYGWWTTHGVKHGTALSAEQMRGYGYERCCCTGVHLPQECPVHGYLW